ncbi:hypothetical protein [Marinoscillum luteum]|uniref:Uncharacterized protein n=1 Tax=Marinoscillum luteum TaxID=861051 RepID=A0ABW7NF51_9BACT
MKVPLFFEDYSKSLEVPFSQSPSDIPTSVQIGNDHIEFNYPIEESSLIDFSVDSLIMKIGKASGKVYEVRVTPSAMNSLTSALDKFDTRDIKTDKSDNRFKSNLKFSKRIVKDIAQFLKNPKKD